MYNTDRTDYENADLMKSYQEFNKEENKHIYEILEKFTPADEHVKEIRAFFKLNAPMIGNPKFSMFMKYIKNPSDEIVFYALSTDYKLAEYVKKVPYELEKKMLKKDMVSTADDFKFISNLKNPTLEIQRDILLFLATSCNEYSANNYFKDAIINLKNAIQLVVITKFSKSKKLIKLINADDFLVKNIMNFKKEWNFALYKTLKKYYKNISL